MTIRTWMIGLGTAVACVWAFSCGTIVTTASCEDWPCGNTCENDSGCLEGCVCLDGVCQ